MITILVTGGIGSGKSTVCSFLSERGFSVYDCDSRCKALYSSVPGLVPLVENATGLPFPELFRVFSDKAALKRLEEVVYPYLLSDIEAWKNTVDSGCCFIESAIALSKPCFDGMYDKVLVVSAPLSLRSERNKAAGQRACLQDPDVEKKADFIIVNDSTLKELESKVDDFLKFIGNEN